jgi:hypothetical protein
MEANGADCLRQRAKCRDLAVERMTDACAASGPCSNTEPIRGKIGFLLLRFFIRAPEPAAKSP